MPEEPVRAVSSWELFKGLVARLRALFPSWPWIVAIAFLGSCLVCRALPSANLGRDTEPDTKAKTAAPATGGCTSNDDCKGGLVCVTRLGTGSRCEKPWDSEKEREAREDHDGILCPHAAKRVLDKAYACGFSTVGLDETSVCAAMTYDRVIYIESLNCREMQNLLAGATGAK
jgi:hypothetical protein